MRCPCSEGPSSSSEADAFSTFTFTDTTAGFTLSTTSAKLTGACALLLTVIGWLSAKAGCRPSNSVAPTAPEATIATAAAEASARLRKFGMVHSSDLEPVAECPAPACALIGQPG